MKRDAIEKNYCRATLSSASQLVARKTLEDQQNLQHNIFSWLYLLVSSATVWTQIQPLILIQSDLQMAFLMKFQHKLPAKKTYSNSACQDTRLIQTVHAKIDLFFQNCFFRNRLIWACPVCYSDKHFVNSSQHFILERGEKSNFQTFTLPQIVANFSFQYQVSWVPATVQQFLVERGVKMITRCFGVFNVIFAVKVSEHWHT